MKDTFKEQIKSIAEWIDTLPIGEKVDAINSVREIIHNVSPFRTEPVDFVKWVSNDLVTANDYNPNSVAPPEMELLRLSISADGYTQPIVAWDKGVSYEVVDGFHRNRVGRECTEVNARVNGYLPLAVIKNERTGKSDRIASTIRHNRARGKHAIDAMSDIVIELKRRNWATARICRELGMDEDEVLRLCQITGLTELFSDADFSATWDVKGGLTVEDFEDLTDDPTAYGEETSGFRTVNTGDPERIFHVYDKWECYKAGFYATSKEGMTRDECLIAYRDFLSDTDRFSKALQGVITEWKHSCEHYLTNSSMNRIAWLGQAAMCYATGVPSTFRGGFSMLTEEEQVAANNCALVYLNKWLSENDRNTVDMPTALASDLQHEIY